MSIVSDGLLFNGKKMDGLRSKTWLEAIRISNIEKKPILPNRFYKDLNRLFLKIDIDEKFKPIVEGIATVARYDSKIYTGTFGVIGDKGKPFEKYVVALCKYQETTKTVIVELDEKYRNFVDTLLTCDHSFNLNGEPSLLLSNAETRELIDTDEKMREINEILLTMRGNISEFKIQNRQGDVLETIENEETQISISSFATIGLLMRHFQLTTFSTIDFFDRPFDRHVVIREAANTNVGNAPHS